MKRIVSPFTISFFRGRKVERRVIENVTHNFHFKPLKLSGKQHEQDYLTFTNCTMHGNVTTIFLFLVQ